MEAGIQSKHLVFCTFQDIWLGQVMGKKTFSTDALKVPL